MPYIKSENFMIFCFCFLLFQMKQCSVLSVLGLVLVVSLSRTALGNPLSLLQAIVEEEAEEQALERENQLEERRLPIPYSAQAKYKGENKLKVILLPYKWSVVFFLIFMKFSIVIAQVIYKKKVHTFFAYLIEVNAIKTRLLSVLLRLWNINENPIKIYKKAALNQSILHRKFYWRYQNSNEKKKKYEVDALWEE